VVHLVAVLQELRGLCRAVGAPRDEGGEDVRAVYDLKGNAYVQKPVDFDRFAAVNVRGLRFLDRDGGTAGEMKQRAYFKAGSQLVCPNAREGIKVGFYSGSFSQHERK
jgi:hypothetical protein